GDDCYIDDYRYHDVLRNRLRYRRSCRFYACSGYQHELVVGGSSDVDFSVDYALLPAATPRAVAAAGIYEASTGRTILYGVGMALIAGAFVAMVWPRLSFVKKMNPTIPEGLAPSKLFEEDEMPDIFTSISVAILPIILIAGAEIY